MKVFISYSHADESYVKMLHKHLAMLKRDGLISVFYDRNILAGDKFDEAIFKELKDSQLFIAITSPDFIASEYCYDRELATALEMHQQNRLRVIPVIVEHCEWKKSPLGSFLAVPEDGKEISSWSNPNAAFLKVVSEIRKIVEDFSQSSVGSNLQNSEIAGLNEISVKAAQKYIAKRSFDKVDKFKFREEAFQDILNFFELSVEEIKTVDGIDARFRNIDKYTFTATIINQSFGRGLAHVTVKIGTDDRRGFGDVFWSNEENSSSDSANGWASIADDDFDLYFECHAFNFTTDQMDRSKLTAHELASIIWEDLISRADISYA